MEQDHAFNSLLHATRDVYSLSDSMMSFAPFPDDLQGQSVIPFCNKSSDEIYNDTKLASMDESALTQAVRSALCHLHWREPYKETNIGQDFRERFACFCIIGEEAPFTSDAIRLYLVYMAPHLCYPWHHHPAEEMYLVVAGNAVFRRKGLPDKTLVAGDTSFHESNQPHAMQTMDDPVLCLVAWRDDFETPPVWSEP